MCCRKPWDESRMVRWIIDALHAYIHRNDKKGEEDTPPPLHPYRIPFRTDHRR